MFSFASLIFLPFIWRFSANATWKSLESPLTSFFHPFQRFTDIFFMWFQSSNKNFVDDGMHIVMDLNKRFQARLFTHLIDTHDDEWDGRVLSFLLFKVLESHKFSHQKEGKKWIISIQWYLYYLHRFVKRVCSKWVEVQSRKKVNMKLFIEQKYENTRIMHDGKR